MNQQILLDKSTTTITDVFNNWCSDRPTAELAADSSGILTYEEAQIKANAFAASLLNAGIKKGDRICVLAPPGLNFLVSFLGTVQIGAIWVGLNPKYTAREIEYVLSAATATKLNDTSFHQLRISDICDQAETSSASFYIYFENKKDITLQLLTLFTEKLYGDIKRRPVETTRSNYQAMYDANLAWLHTVRHNCGLMRCLLQVSYEDDEFTAFYRKMSFKYNEWVTEKIAKRITNAPIDKNKLALKVFAYSAMTDEFTRRLIEGKRSHLDKLVKKTYHSDEELAHFLSELWHKSIFE